MKTSIPKTLFALLVAFSTAAAIAQVAQKQDAPAAQSAPKFRELSRTEFDALLAKPDNLTIIDLRRPDELTSIGGFPVFLSIQPAELEKHLAYIPKDRSIVTVSNHVARSGRAAELLASKGFKVLGAVGAQTYEEHGGTLTKVAPRAPRNAASAPEKK